MLPDQKKVKVTDDNIAAENTLKNSIKLSLQKIT